MKKNIFLFTLLVSIVLIYACGKSFLDKRPIGPTDQATLANKAGVQGLLIGAYSLLDGVGGAGGGWGAACSNWVYGGVASDDAYKGTDPGDQPDINSIETYSVTATNSYPTGKWNLCYDAIQRCNDVLRVMALATDLTDAEKTAITAEVRFLRGHYHFELKRMFKNIVYIDETISYEAGNYRIPNNTDVWPNIEADFQFAAANLPATQPQVGRANSWAAKAYLAKVYLYEHKFAEALPIFTDVINNGRTAGDKKYDLVNYADNFNPAKKNSAESVFAVQMSVQDGAGGHNGNYGDALNFPYGGPAGCCGFYQPSQTLVNSFKTDAVSGLPDPDGFNAVDVKSDQGLTSSQPFTPYTGTLDPRLDWTVGRRGVPYLDYGLHPGASWIRNQANGGPYSPIKNVYYLSQQGQLSDTYDGWATNEVTANNYNIIRFADVLLMAAECEVEAGSLDQAEAYVNRVRARAADTDGWVKAIAGGDNYGGFAANYFIKEYPAGNFTANGQDYARKCVQFERKLEMGMEGVRFFDLVRYGTAATVLNAYIAKEKSQRIYLQGATFTAGKNEIFPIPQEAIDKSAVDGTPTLTQNPGY